MTYRNRVKKPNRHLNPPHWAKRLMLKDQEWFERWFGKTGYKVGYTRRRGYSDTINPHSGKYQGWRDSGYKERGLKKRHRAYSRLLIQEELMAMDKVCPWCGLEGCDNPASCKDEYELLIEFEIEMMELYEYDLLL